MGRGSGSPPLGHQQACCRFANSPTKVLNSRFAPVHLGLPVGSGAFGFASGLQLGETIKRWERQAAAGMSGDMERALCLDRNSLACFL